MEEALKRFNKAAEQGNADAQYKLGVCYENGKGVPQNMVEALKWFRKAAEQGNADALYELGVCYENGKGVPQNTEEAMKWYNIAAEHGNDMAQKKYLSYLKNTGVIAKGIPMKISYYQLTTEHDNLVIILKYFLKCLKNYFNYKGRARRKEFWYFVLFSSILIFLWHFIWIKIDCFNILQGNQNTQNNNLFYVYYSLYCLLFFPLLTVTSRRFHDSGNSLGIFIGIVIAVQIVLLRIIRILCYLIISLLNKFNIGLTMRHSPIIIWLIVTTILFYFLIKKGNKGNNLFGSDPRLFDPVQLSYRILNIRNTANQGNAKAQCSLGICYYYGIGVSKDMEEAERWFRQAAMQGDANAQNNLGVCYKNAKDSLHSLEEAVSWFHKAAEQGNAEAQYNLGVCYSLGEGVSQNMEAAASWFRQAKEKGDFASQCILQASTNKGKVDIYYLPIATVRYQQVEEEGDIDELSTFTEGHSNSYGNGDSDNDDGGDDDGDWDCDFDD